MRISINRLTAVLAIAVAGCSPSGVIVRQPAAPQPMPVVVIDPLDVDIARPHNGKLFVQTNRAAYVAIFEIVPDRSVTLVYPVSARQQRFVVTGLRDVPVWWEPSRVTYRGAGSSSSPRSQPTRYIYVLASEEPLRIPDAAFRDGYLYQTLGNQAYRATNPYATMRALAREFVPSVADERWAEDAYALSRSYATERYDVTRVYCRDGSVYEVPTELADHVWCPASARQADGPGRVSEVDLPPESRRPPMRPDSVVGDNGRRVATRARGSNGRGPIDRVKEPVQPENRGNRRTEDDERSRNNETRDRQESGSEGRSHRPNDAHDDATPKQRGPELKVATPLPHRPKPVPQPVPQPVDNSVDKSVDKPTKVESPDSSPKSETPAKPDGTSETKPDSTSEAKSQGPGEKRAEPGKRRGRPDAPDEKSADRNPRQPADSKPVS